MSAWTPASSNCWSAPPEPVARVLATVVATAGSTYRKPGARMLIMADGSYLGLLSGGCLEADLKLHAQQVMAGGTARAVEYDMRGPDDILFGIGAGCEGAMRVLLEPANALGRAAAALAGAGRITRSGVPAVPRRRARIERAAARHLRPAGRCPRSRRGGRAVAAPQGARASSILERGAERVRAFVQFLAPPPHLLICGAGPDAAARGDARRARWDGASPCVDHRPAYADARRLSGRDVMLADAGSAALDRSISIAAMPRS